jgi:hypothetical protein
MKNALLLSALLVSGCATTQLTPAGTAVRTAKGDAPMACTEIGPVIGQHNGVVDASGNVPQQTIQAAYVSLRNTAADRGGNFVRVQSEGEVPGMNEHFVGYRIVGIAYHCPGAGASGEPGDPQS